MDPYPDIYSKVALALTSAQVAKEVLVADEGCGADIPFNFFGWDGDELALVVQLDRGMMKNDFKERFEMCMGAIHMMRNFWCVDEITFVAEGYHSKTPELTKDLNLAQEFANGNENVRECLALSHVYLDFEDTPQVMLVSCPYSYLGSTTIMWEDNVGFTQGSGSVLREAAMPAMIGISLRGPCSSEDEIQGENPIEILNANGFNVQEF